MAHELVLFDKQEWNDKIAEITRLREEFYSLPKETRLNLGNKGILLLDKICFLEAQIITNEAI